MVKHLRKITEFKVLKLVHFYMKIDILKLKSFSFWGTYPPDQGLCPWTPLGALPPDPLIDSRSRARHKWYVCPPPPQPLNPSDATANDSNISLELTIINNPIRKVVHNILKCDILRNRIIPEYVEVFDRLMWSTKSRLVEFVH